MKLRFWRKTPEKKEKYAQSVDDRSWTRIFDWVLGSWQTHDPYDSSESVLAYPTVFSCQTTIANDIAKLKPVIQARNGKIWSDIGEHEITDLLKKPNDYQNTLQFLEAWVHSKLSHGNTYVLKGRIASDRNKIAQLIVLDPLKVEPLVADNGDVYYRLKRDRLAKVDQDEITVPASEIIHDRFNCLYHPLIGLSPIFAAAASAQTGLSSQKNIKNFFKNSSNPGGILSAPGPISDTTAKRLKEDFESSFSGDNSGRVAVAGDGLQFTPMRMSNVDAQVLELMGWNDERICSVYHVPAYMANVGEMPKFDNIEALVRSYYSQCLQILIEALETALDEGLGVEKGLRLQLDVEAGLFRMDSETLVKTLGEGTKGGLYAPDEAREKLNLPPVPGGQYPYMQQQNYSLEALARRDADNPLGETETTDDFQRALDTFDILSKSIPVH